MFEPRRQPRIAIVIPVGPSHQRLLRCLASCDALDYAEKKTIVVSDEPRPDLVASYDVTNVVTHADRMTGPAIKRDLAFASFPDFDIYAFLDDDAYVPADWLSQAARVFERNATLWALGGPGLMPDDQTIAEQLSAAAMESPFGSGSLRFRFVELEARLCEDFPAYNLFVTRSALEAVGGWASDLYGGEDTFLCSKIVVAGGTIGYDPSVAVFHYRRPIFPAHFWQISNVGRSRACFYVEGESSSQSLVYRAPLMASIGMLAVGAAAIRYERLRKVTFATSAISYVLLAFLGHRGRIAPAVRALLPLGLTIHHLSYAYGFAVGLVTRRRNR